MKAVVLAAGEGNRMRPLTFTRPKVMLPVANRPILEHLLLQFKQAGINDFVFVVGYHGETVREYFGDGTKWGVSISYITQKQQMGTAHAVKTVEGLVDEAFLLANGDVMLHANDIARVRQKRTTTLSLFEVEDATSLGVVEVRGKRIRRIHEKLAKPPTNLANAGLYLLTRDIFTALSQTAKSPRGEYEITDSLQWLIDQGRAVSYEKLDFWLDLSYPWDLLAANQYLLETLQPENLGQIEDNVVIKGAVTIGKGTTVRANSYIVGPVTIGERCDIGPNCYLRPSTAIGDGCHIGAAVEVKNSIVMRNTAIPHHNYVGDSVIGEGCNLGAGTKIANLRLDKAKIEAKGVATGRHKFGAIIGDGVQTGINASINVGSMIGCDSWIGPGALVSGVLLPNSRVF